MKKKENYKDLRVMKYDEFDDIDMDFLIVSTVKAKTWDCPLSNQQLFWFKELLLKPKRGLIVVGNLDNLNRSDLWNNILKQLLVTKY